MPTVSVDMTRWGVGRTWCEGWGCSARGWVRNESCVVNGEYIALPPLTPSSSLPPSPPSHTHITQLSLNSLQAGAADAEPAMVVSSVPVAPAQTDQMPCGMCPVLQHPSSAPFGAGGAQAVASRRVVVGQQTGFFADNADPLSAYTLVDPATSPLPEELWSVPEPKPAAVEPKPASPWENRSAPIGTD